MAFGEFLSSFAGAFQATQQQRFQTAFVHFLVRTYGKAIVLVLAASATLQAAFLAWMIASAMPLIG
jgi:ABC-type transporter MlaC component